MFDYIIQKNGIQHQQYYTVYARGIGTLQLSLWSYEALMRDIGTDDPLDHRIKLAIEESLGKPTEDILCQK